MEEPSEGLVRAAAAGDDDAFATLVHHYEDHVRRFLVHFLGDATLAEDVAQDTFVRVYRGLPSFSFRSGLSSWVFQVARNCAIDALRSRRRRDRIVVAVTPARSEEGASRDLAPSASAEVTAAIASLGDKARRHSSWSRCTASPTGRPVRCWGPPKGRSRAGCTRPGASSTAGWPPRRPPVTCDHAQQVLSALFDDEAGEGGEGAEARRHADACPDCARFARHAASARALLRPDARELGGSGRPDPTSALAAAALARVRREDAAGEEDGEVGSRVGADRTDSGAAVGRTRRSPAAPRRRHLPAAAVFVAAALGAALLVHTSTSPEGPGVAEADLAERVDAAQHAVHDLEARLTVVEHGWHPAVPERRFDGRLDYAAPETLRLELRDHTDYPALAWRPNDLHLIVDEDTWTVAGLVDCPSPAQPDCTPTAGEHRTLVGRAPFSPAAPAPLELVMPVQSFALTGALETLPPAEVDGRPTIGIETTAAQIGPLLDALRPTGNLRAVHPTDPVRLRLDRDTLVPLRVTVRAGRAPERAAWAADRGYTDVAGRPVLDVTVHDLSVNTGSAPASPGAVTSASSPSVSDGGFRDRPVTSREVPEPSSLPDGLTPHRTGRTETLEGPTVATRTWTDGRAWLAVSATSSWPGGRLFGDLGTLVRRLDLGPAGVGYLGERGDRVGLHTDGLDVVVSGSVGRDDLVAVASELDLRGQDVPASWDEAATADLATARAAIDPLLLPEDLDGFGPPALRVEGTRVLAAYTGPGDRAFVLDQTTAAKLSPPIDADDVQAVTVRAVAGRYVRGQGALEWFEQGRAYGLRSLSLSRAELLDVAEHLRPA